MSWIRGLHKLAILAGFAVDVAGTLLTGGAVIAVSVVVATIQSGGKAELDFISQWASDPVYLLVLMVVGVGWVVAGGFVAALIARRDHVPHAAWVGIVSLAWGLLFMMAPGADQPRPPLWYEITSYAITIPSAVAGGLLARIHTGHG